jgi:hypothetical protein
MPLLVTRGSAPQIATCMPALTSLDVSFNALHTLPLCLERLVRGAAHDALRVSGNPLTLLPWLGAAALLAEADGPPLASREAAARVGGGGSGGGDGHKLNAMAGEHLRATTAAGALARRVWAARGKEPEMAVPRNFLAVRARACVLVCSDAAARLRVSTIARLAVD